MSRFGLFSLLCSDLLCIWSPPGVCFHLPIRTSKTGHIQAEPAGHRQGVQTETDHCVSHWPAAEESLSLSLVDQVTFKKDLRELLNQGDHGAEQQSCFQFKVGLLPRSSPLQTTWDWWQYYEFPDNLKNSLILAGLSNLSVDI